MRNLLDPDQMLSSDWVRTATMVLTLFLAIIAAFMTLSAIGSLFTGHPVEAFTKVAFGIGVPLAVWLIVRTLSEMLLAHHRLNDRLSVIAERLGEQRQDIEADDVAPAVVERAEVEDAVENIEKDVVDKVEDVVEEVKDKVKDEPKPKRRRKSAKSDDA